jgi:hypothetical protein
VFGYILREPISAEMRIAAFGSRLAQQVLMALQHEGKPWYLSNESYLKRFAHTGWDKGETEQAYKVLEMWAGRGFSDTRDAAYEGVAGAAGQVDGVETLEYYAGLLEQYEGLPSDEELARQKDNILRRISSGDLSVHEEQRLFVQLAELNNLMKTRAEVVASLSAEGAMTSYREAMAAVYGISVNDSDEPLPSSQIEALMALENYRRGADEFAQFLVDVYLGEGAENQDRYAFFRAVMGDITIIRTDDTIQEDGKDITGVKGYAGGHRIYDLFNSFTNQMSAINFTHELGHSFNAFSGKGFTHPGSFFAVPGLDYAALEQLLLSSETDELRLQNPVITSDGVDDDEVSEILADMILFASAGAIPEFVAEYRTQFRAAIRNAISFNSPEVYQQAFGATSSTTLNTRAMVRVNPGTLGQEFRAFDADTNVTPLARAVDENNDTWVYMGLYFDVAGGTVYGWVHSDSINLSEAQLNALTPVDPTQLDPTYFDENSPFNPYG